MYNDEIQNEVMQFITYFEQIWSNMHVKKCWLELFHLFLFIFFSKAWRGWYYDIIHALPYPYINDFIWKNKYL